MLCEKNYHNFTQNEHNVLVQTVENISKTYKSIA